MKFKYLGREYEIDMNKVSPEAIQEITMHGLKAVMCMGGARLAPNPNKSELVHELAKLHIINLEQGNVPDRTIVNKLMPEQD